jgi:shikimate dehydrogenase
MFDNYFGFIEMKFFGVVGYPVLHSKSPEFFNAIFAENNIDAKYTRIAAESMSEAMYLFDSIGFDGFNITTPFKEDALEFCDDLNEIAKSINAVNIISNWDGMKVGFNSDYFGVINTFKRNKIDLNNKKILLLGGGNAAKAAIYALQQYRNNTVMVSRNTVKTRSLAQKFDIKFETIQNLPNILNQFDILLSTIPNETIALKKEWFTNKELLIFDANYNKSRLSDIAKELKIKYISGLEWLVNQAFPSYKTFTGNSADYNSKLLKLITTNNKSQNNNIYLVGFMGTGKTTVGRALAEKMGKEFYDIDDMIIQDENKSIYDIFSVKGEGYFRDKETEILENLSKKSNSIISCGGGIILKKENIDLLSRNSFVIWLYADINSCLNRMKLKTRPLLANGNPYPIAQKLMKERMKFYMQVSDLLINSEKSIEKIVDRLFEEFKKSGYYD